jgi:hypothetical protein
MRPLYQTALPLVPEVLFAKQKAQPKSHGQRLRP